MSEYLENKAEKLNSDAVNAVDNALDATPNREDCEAWYEAMEAVLLWQYPNGKEEVREALKLVRNVIDERYL